MRLHTPTLLIIIGAHLVIAGALDAQQVADRVQHSVVSRVEALLVVRRATYPEFGGRSGDAVTALSVGANVRHDVLVRLAAPSDAIVEVRDARGTFRRVTEEPVVIATAAAGTHQMEVTWRLRGTTVASSPPAISYLVNVSEAH